MKYAHRRFLLASMLTLGLLLLGACSGNPFGGQLTNAPNNAPGKQSANPSAATNRGAAGRDGCVAMTAEVAAIAGFELRPPLELHDPNEGLLRGCTWTDTKGALNTVGITKETASKYAEHNEDKYRKNFPEQFKQLKGFGDRAFVAPMVNEGWTACALRSSETFCVEFNGEATTEDQATRLLRLALDRF